MIQKGKISVLENESCISPVNIPFSSFSLRFYSGLPFGNMKGMCLLQQLLENELQNSVCLCKQGVVDELNFSEKFRPIYHQFLISSWFLELRFNRVYTI